MNLVDLDEDSGDMHSPEMRESSMFALTSTSLKAPAYFSREMNYSIIKPHLDLPPQERVTFMQSPMSRKYNKSKFYTETSNDSCEEIRRSR